jgi:hypothetical protein
MLVNRGTGYFIEKGENKNGMPGGMPLEQFYALHIARFSRRSRCHHPDHH